MGLIHVDAHDDTADAMLGEKIAHGTTFRRAGEEGCLDFSKVFQIGLRGTGTGPTDYEYGESKVSSVLHESIACTVYITVAEMYLEKGGTCTRNYKTIKQ